MGHGHVAPNEFGLKARCGGPAICAECALELAALTPKFDEEFFLKIVEEWKHYWMDQTQNSEADRENYFSRAFGVDANMKHDLARRLAKKVSSPSVKLQEE